MFIVVHTWTHRYIHTCTHWYTHMYTQVNTSTPMHRYTYAHRAEKDSHMCFMTLGYILSKLTSSSTQSYNIKIILFQTQVKKLAQIIMLVFFEQLMCDQNEVSHGWCRCWVIATHLEYLSVNANFKYKYSVIPRCVDITQHIHTHPAVSY